MRIRKTRNSKNATPVSEDTLLGSTVPEENNDADFAAIALALSMYVQDIHDYERAVLTIQKVMRPYSPWSSKIYGLRQTPLRIPGLRTIVKK